MLSLQHAESVLKRKAGSPGNGKTAETTTHIRMARRLGANSVLDNGGADGSRRLGSAAPIPTSWSAGLTEPLPLRSALQEQMS
jgi:hypothetical protein